MSLRRLRDKRCGEGAGRPGLARCWCRVYRFDEVTAPRGRYPLAPPAGGPCRASPASRTSPRGAAGRRNMLTVSTVAVPSEGARRASGQDPSLPSRTPGLSSARASSLDHSPPSSRNVDPTPSPSTGWATVWTHAPLRRARDAGAETMCRENSDLAVRIMETEAGFAAQQLLHLPIGDGRRGGQVDAKQRPGGGGAGRPGLCANHSPPAPPPPDRRWRADLSSPFATRMGR